MRSESSARCFSDDRRAARHGCGFSAGDRGADVADVTLTATFTRTEISTGERTMDAREFALEVQKDAGEWRIARVVAIETLR